MTHPQPGQPLNAVGTNTGHGHVWKRPDGVRMRCGGPRMCAACAKDAALLASTVLAGQEALAEPSTAGDFAQQNEQNPSSQPDVAGVRERLEAFLRLVDRSPEDDEDFTIEDKLARQVVMQVRTIVAEIDRLSAEVETWKERAKAGADIRDSFVRDGTYDGAKGSALKRYTRAWFSPARSRQGGHEHG